MKWHNTKCMDQDRFLWHLADSKYWKSFDKNFEEFCIEPRNVRLELASDNFNPFGRMDIT